MASWKKLSVKDRKCESTRKVQSQTKYFWEKKNKIFSLRQFIAFWKVSLPFVILFFFFFFKNRFIARQVASYATSCNKIFYWHLFQLTQFIFIAQEPTKVNFKLQNFKIPLWYVSFGKHLLLFAVHPSFSIVSNRKPSPP